VGVIGLEKTGETEMALNDGPVSMKIVLLLLFNCPTLIMLINEELNKLEIPKH